MALAPTTEIRLMLAGVVYFILFLDWLAMLVAHLVVRWSNPNFYEVQKSDRRRRATWPDLRERRSSRLVAQEAEGASGRHASSHSAVRSQDG